MKASINTASIGRNIMIIDYPELKGLAYKNLSLALRKYYSLNSEKNDGGYLNFRTTMLDRIVSGRGDALRHVMRSPSTFLVVACPESRIKQATQELFAEAIGEVKTVYVVILPEKLDNRMLSSERLAFAVIGKGRHLVLDYNGELHDSNYDPTYFANRPRLLAKVTESGEILNVVLEEI